MRFPWEKRIFMVKKNHQLSSSLKVQQAWITKYPGQKPPPAETANRPSSGISQISYRSGKLLMP